MHYSKTLDRKHLEASVRTVRADAAVCGLHVVGYRFRDPGGQERTGSSFHGTRPKNLPEPGTAVPDLFDVLRSNHTRRSNSARS